MIWMRMRAPVYQVTIKGFITVENLRMILTDDAGNGNITFSRADILEQGELPTLEQDSLPWTKP